MQSKARALSLGNERLWRRYLAEVLGDPRMSGLGRLRRHMATASLCKLAVANASPALRDTRRMAKALALGLRTLAERPDYEVRATFMTCVSPVGSPGHMACTCSSKGLICTPVPCLFKPVARLFTAADKVDEAPSTLGAV